MVLLVKYFFNFTKHCVYVSFISVLLVVVSIIEIRAASLPKSIPDDGMSTADFSPALQDRHREAIHGGKRVITNPDKSNFLELE